MRRACDEARLWLGSTSPNPPVGAVALDKEGHILAAAAHQRAGTDHAETALLKICRAQNLISRMHTMCVTLEPCNHQGRTPPCTEAIIESGVKRVAIGIRDPNPHVAGGGCERMRAAGIEIIENIEGEICRHTMHAYLYHAQTGQPFITLKRAFDATGSMIPPPGHKTFTAHSSLLLAHRLRKKAGAIITGSGTILADRPLFTVRHLPDYPDVRRVLAILDRRSRVPQDYIDEATRHGLDVFIFKDFDSCLNELRRRNINDVLVESGPILSRFVLDSCHWTMQIDIHTGEKDKVHVGFNPAVTIPFNTSELDLESLLPL